MKVVLRNPRRELDVPRTEERRAVAARARPRARVGARDPQRHARDSRREAARRRRGGDPARDVGRRDMKCRRCGDAAVIDVRRHNAGFCRDCFLRHCREQVRARGRRVLDDPSGGACARRGVGRQGLARAVAPPARLGYDADGLYVGLGIGEYSDESGSYARAFARRPQREAPRGRPRRFVRLRHSRRLTRGQARAVLGVRVVEAPPVQRHGRHARLRRARDRPQPRRRSRGAVRQRDALGDGIPRAPASGARGRARLRAQGETVDPHQRARDGGVLRAHRDRLHRRGMPDGRRQPSPRLQGAAEPARGALAGDEGGVRVALPRARATALPRRGYGRPRRPAPVRVVRLADAEHRRRHADVRVLPDAARAVGEPIGLRATP